MTNHAHGARDGTGGAADEHPPFERLSDLVDGALPAAERDAVERHLAACAACRADADALRRVLALAGSAPRAAEPPPEVWTAVRARMAETPTLRARRAWWRRPAALGTAAGLLAAASLALVVRDRADDAAASREMDPEIAAVIAFADRTLADPAYRPAHRPPPPTLLGSTRLAELELLVRGRVGDASGWRVSRQDGAPEGHWVACDPFRGCVNVILPAARHASASDDVARELSSTIATGAAADGGASALPPAARASLDRNLALVESAIAEARAALASDPGNVAVADALGAAQERRVELLLQATRILTDE